MYSDNCFVIIEFIAEYNYYNVGLVPSRFYSALTQNDPQQFKESLYQSIIAVFSAGIVRYITNIRTVCIQNSVKVQ